MRIMFDFFSRALKPVFSTGLVAAALVLSCLPIIAFSKGAGTADSDTSKIIKSAFDPKLAAWNIDWPGRISQYDLVYKSPPVDPMQGIALGNGDVAVLAWCEGSKIVMVVNKCDLWDDSKSEKPETWNEKYDYYTTQRQACRIEIDFEFPVFSTLYLTDFNARLNLADASLSLTGSSPFGELKLKAFIDHQSGNLFCDLGSSFNENVPLHISMERFGSRTFSMWYTRMKRDATIGLSGTEASADDKNVFITQKLATGTFAVGGSVIQSNGLTVSCSREHSRRSVIHVSGKREKNVLLAFSVTAPLDSDPLPEVKNRLSAIHEKGIEPFKQSHTEHWKSIWNRSFMDYGDDYLNNLWVLTMYYANASQGGKYPGRFNNGLWSWSHDVQQWNFYFHWNQQQLYWPLNAAGYHDLVAPYLDFRFNSLRHAKKDAREFYHTDGAFISDVTNRNGYNRIDLDVKDNHTPVAEIAMEFWRQYQFTADKKYLKEKALPFLLEAAKFFESLFEKGADSLYHAREGTGYEGTIKMRDGLAELVYARTLLSTVLEAIKVAGAEIPEAHKWKEMLDRLAPIPVVKAAEGLIVKDKAGDKINLGIFNGTTVSGDKIVAAGWGVKEKMWLTTWYKTDDPAYAYLLAGDSTRSKKSEFRVLDGIFPAVPRSPVFPSGLVGLAQKEEPLFQVMTATTLLYGTECMGWDPVPIVLARLGLARELAINLEQFPARWQFYVNGWGHISGDASDDKDGGSFFRTNQVSVIGSPDGEKVPLPVWPFRHMSMESMSLLVTAMNESLLQSYDGTIRIFPAFKGAKTARFTLHAQGGFVVSSEIKCGVVQWIAIKSLYGNPCKLELPWNNFSVQSNINRKTRTISGKITSLKTKPDEVIILMAAGQNFQSWSVAGEKPLPNENVKYHPSGKTQLGIPRMF
jgi:alpha-L-fucosidase 2